MSIDIREELESKLRNRIMIIDGAVDTILQSYKLEEDDFKGELFKTHNKLLKGNNDVLSLTQPEIVYKIHKEYLDAGADIIKTNTFNGTRIVQSDYGLESEVYNMNLKSASIARKVCDEAFEKSGITRYVAGVMGPTNRVNKHEFRNITFDQFVTAYKEQAQALLDGGVDVFLIETIFDTANAKAAIYSLFEIFEEIGHKIPVFISGTILDKSGRTKSSQTIEAFITSVSHIKPMCIGLNCAVGAAEMRPFIETISTNTTSFVICYPNAGLPNTFGNYDEKPEVTGEVLRQFAENGLLNIVGGCCGTMPSHIAAIKKAVLHCKPRIPPKSLFEDCLVLSGLERLVVNPKSSSIVNIGERCNLRHTRRFVNLIKTDKFDEALSIAKDQVENGAQVLDINMDEGIPYISKGMSNISEKPLSFDSSMAMTKYINLISSDPDISQVPLCIASSNFSVIEAGLKCTQGKCIVNCISLAEGEEELLRKVKKLQKFGAAVIIMTIDENGPAKCLSRKAEICERIYKLLVDENEFDPNDIIFDPLVSHRDTIKDFIDTTKYVKKTLPRAKVCGGVSDISFSFPGKKVVREAMHSVFLYHAQKAGLDMGFVHAGYIPDYNRIEPKLIILCEDVLWNLSPESIKALRQYAETTIDASLSLPINKRSEPSLVGDQEETV